MKLTLVARSAAAPGGGETPLPRLRGRDYDGDDGDDANGAGAALERPENKNSSV